MKYVLQDVSCHFALLLATGLCAFTASPALAQTQSAAAKDASTLEEVIVTAQRREERLQDVPIAISAVSSDRLSNIAATSLSDLGTAVPGLTMTSFAATNATNLISIRGVSGQGLPIGAGQATAVYIDGVYLSRPDAGFFSLDDIERVEVLRGPQGTLYGRNSTAGAINIVTRDPGESLQGGFDVSAGNFNAYNMKGSLSGPLGGGFFAGISASADRRDGYFTNLFSNSNIGKRESHTLRGKLRYATSDDKFSATLAVDESRREGQEVLKNAYVGTTLVGMGDPKTVNLDDGFRNPLKVRGSGASLKLVYRANENLELTSITGARKVDTNTMYDADGGALPGAIVAIAENHSKTLSEELRAVITAGAFRATVGANAYGEDASFSVTQFVPPTTFLRGIPSDTSEIRAYAAFGQFEYDFTDQLTAVAGLRYNKEKRTGTVAYPGFPGGAHYNAEVEDEVLIPSVGLNFKATPDVLIYVKAGRGYQAPGFNVSPGPFYPVANTFDAETLWAYEGGVKSQFLDRRVTLNVSAYYYDYKDLQLKQTVGVGIANVSNVGAAVIKGLEAEYSWRLADSLTLSGHVAYTDAQYEQFCEAIQGASPLGGDPPCVGTGMVVVGGVPTPTPVAGGNRKGNRLNGAPEWSGAVNLDYRTEIGSGQLNAHVDFSWETNVYYTSVNEAAVSSGGWQRWGARIGYKLASGPEIYAYGRNLTDDRSIAYASRITPTIIQEGASDPRTFGVGVRERF